MTAQTFGLALYSVRDQLEKDFQGTLRQVADLGFASVEFAGYGGLSASELRALLQEIGLTPLSSHIPLDALQGEELEASLRYCVEAGIQTVVLPWLTPEWRTETGFRKLLPLIQQAAERIAHYQLHFAYHHHDFEFATFASGKTFLETLLESTDPTLVKLELDCYWAAYAGHDPLELCQRYRDRLHIVHLKDMANDHQSMTEVGSGVLPLLDVAALAQVTGVPALVELDNPLIPSLESVSQSLRYLQEHTAK